MAKKQVKPIVCIQPDSGIPAEWLSAFKQHPGFTLGVAILNSCGGCTLKLKMGYRGDALGVCMPEIGQIVLYVEKSPGNLYCTLVMISTFLHEVAHFIQFSLNRFDDFNELSYAEKIAEDEARAFQEAAMALLGR
jgi:hypothetical protein